MDRYHLDFYTSETKLVIIASEAIEPFAMYFIGRLFDRCERAREIRDELNRKAKDEDRELTLYEMLDVEKFVSVCSDLWYGIKHLSGLGICARTPTHFTIACGNYMGEIAMYIKEHTGIDPFKEWD